MLGSALETVLILMVNCYSDEAARTGKVPTRNGKPIPLLHWRLADLLRVAKAAEWLPSGLDLNEEWDSRRAKVGDRAEVVRMLRNLAHPARYCEDHFRKRLTKLYLKRQFEFVTECRDWLIVRNNKTLIQHMDHRSARFRQD